MRTTSSRPTSRGLAHGARYGRRLLITGPARHPMDRHERNRHAICHIDTLDTRERSVRRAHDLKQADISREHGARYFLQLSSFSSWPGRTEYAGAFSLLACANFFRSHWNRCEMRPSVSPFATR